MPKRLNSDAEAYDKEHDAFIKQLEDFHQQRGTPFKRLPKINGKAIDLYLLYVVVTAKGGWQKVNSKNEWSDLLQNFWLNPACSNACTALKHIYIRYLDVYERIHFHGEDGNEQNNDGDEDESRATRIRRSVRSLNNVPLTYNYQQHNVTDLQRLNSGLSKDLYQSSPYERLALSLASPLPNENDFAFNMCTLLSNEGKLTLKLSECPRLIELMIGHTGVFKEEFTQKYFITNYKEAKGKNLLQFWADSISDSYVLKLLEPPELKKLELVPSGPQISDQSTDSRNVDQRGDCVALTIKTKEGAKEPAFKLEPTDTELFHLGRDLGLLDSEGTRISQVLHILRNLSFEENNVSLLAKSETCLRFLVLCICSRWGALSVGALDTLGNIASEIVLREPKNDDTCHHFLKSVCKGVSSQDRSFVLRCLEVLNKLAANDSNEEILNEFIEQMVYDQICQYLTIHDIMLLIYTLECLFSLSSLGTHACNAIVRAKGSVQTLVSLLTVEAQSYGPDACIGMRVVETTVIGSYKADQPDSQRATPTTSMAAPPVTTTTQSPKAITTSSGPSTPKPRPIADPKRIAARVVPPEVEDFAVDWIRRNYVMTNDSDIGVEQALVIRHFTAAMSANGKRHGCNPVFLSNMVKKVFGPGIGPTRRKVEDGTEKWHYTGIRRRDDTKINSIAPTPIVPKSDVKLCEGSILKAHLSAPLRNSPSPVRGHLRSPSPYGTDRPHNNPSDNSTLIKSLLANKVTSPVVSPAHRFPQSGPLPSMPFTKLAQTVLNNANQNHQTIPSQQISRHMQNGPIETSMDSRSTLTNGLPVDNKKGDTETLPTSFEGILQNGLKDEKPADSDRKNLLADLLEKTVGGEVLNGVVGKDIVRNKTNGLPESVGVKRSASPDNNPSKRVALDPGQAQDSKITLYVSQNGNEGEILSQGHQVVYNQGTISTSTSGQVLNTQTVVTPQGQVIIQRALPQGNVILQRGTPPQRNIIPTTGSNSLITQSVPTLNSNGQVIQQVIAQNGQKVILHGNQLGQVLLPSSSQGLVVQGSSGQVLMQGVSSSTGPMYVQATNGQGQQVLVQANQVSSSNQSPMVVNSSGQTMFLTNQGQQVVVGNPSSNAVFLTPQQSSGQKTLIILPNQKLGLPNQTSQPSRQVVTSTPQPRPIRSPVQVNTVAPLPKGPMATPVSSVSVAPMQTSPSPAPKKYPTSGLQYVCDWRGCNEVFPTPGLVYHHACRVHCPPNLAEITCQWQGCEPMVRRRFSAMTHIQDRHCNEQLLQVHALRRQQMQTTGSTDIPIPQATPPHPGYAPNAAFHAIKRHAVEVLSQRDAVETEGPVTKSIRLTAALVLRNLVIYSNMGKKLLIGHESELANVAISSMESSRTVGQILYDINTIDQPGG